MYDDGPRQDEWEQYDLWLIARDAALLEFGDRQGDFETYQEYLADSLAREHSNRQAA